MPTDWFRSADWSPAAQEDFEQRLARAREWKRPQYLRIKALALLDSPNARMRASGRDLLARLASEYADAAPGEACFAHELLGNAYRREGELGEAERHYRTCMSLAPPSRSGTSGLYDLSLVEILLMSPDDRVGEAEALLADVRRYMEAHPQLNSDLFRYEVAAARVAERVGHRQQAAASARRELELAAIDRPQLPRHPDVGMVHADNATLAELRVLARIPGKTR